MAKIEQAGQGRTPMRNLLAPHSVPVEQVAGRPFFMVTASMSMGGILAPHLTRKISTDLDGVVMSGNSGAKNFGQHPERWPFPQSFRKIPR